jgi:hypothetical protein
MKLTCVSVPALHKKKKGKLMFYWFLPRGKLTSPMASNQPPADYQ